jgi:hypothetical protein
MLPELTRGPGEGGEWPRLAEWLRSQLPVEQIDGIWVFRVVRRELKEYGTAVLSRIDGDRRRIYTARYVATIKGRERGGWEADITEVGSGPLEALHELLALVPVRADDEDPPAPVEVTTWFPPGLPVPPDDADDAFGITVDV